MSAFMCSDLHINTLVAWAAARPVYRVSFEWGGSCTPFAGNESRIAGILATANRESVYARYSHDDESAPIAHRYKAPATLPAPLVILKQCDCFEYQACEVENYNATIAAAIIDAIRRAAINALPGYNDAPWGI